METHVSPANCTDFLPQSGLVRPGGGVLCSPPSPAPGQEHRHASGAAQRSIRRTPLERRLRPAPGARSTRRPTRRGSAPPSRASSSTTTFVVVVPNDFTREWIEGHFLGFCPRRRAARSAATCACALAVGEEDGTAPRPPTARPRATGGGRGAARVEPQVHVRQLRDRLVEPLRARRRARGRGGAGAGLQPALHLRRHGPRQDAPAAGDRRVRRATTRRG